MESYYSQFIENCKHSTNERDQARGAIAARLTLCLKTFQLQGSCSSSGGSDGVRCSQLHKNTNTQVQIQKYTFNICENYIVRGVVGLNSKGSQAQTLCLKKN